MTTSTRPDDPEMPADPMPTPTCEEEGLGGGSIRPAKVSTPADPRPDAEPPPLIPLLPYQKADVENAARFNWSCWSRQTGKSFTKSLRRLLRGILRRRNQVFLSAGERQSRELMLKVRQHCQALNIFSAAQGGNLLGGTRYSNLVIALPNGVRIIGLPANATTARGFTGDVFLDEFAMHRDDRAIWAAVFPSVLRDGGELDVASTPKGRDNMFAELRDNPSFRHSTVTLADAIAAGLKVDAEEIRRSMGDDELYRQEFDCEFLDESSAFLTYEQISRAEDPMLDKTWDLDALAASAGPLYCGVDIGRHRDLTVMWVVEEVGGALLTRGVRESRDEPFREQSAALAALMANRRVRHCCIDAGGIGMPLAEAAIEAFGSTRVEAVTFTSSVKDEMASRLRMRVEDGTLRIPADEAIRNDWHSVRRSVVSIGPARYEAGHGSAGHADRFWAACLAVRAAGSGSVGVVEMLRGHTLTFARRGVW